MKKGITRREREVTDINEIIGILDRAKIVHEAMMTGADAYVTSEISHDLFIDAKTHDFALYDCGHYYTENPVCEKIKTLLCDNFEGLET